ncbi:hypothetical protein SAMN06265379_101680 [Saccharicrinis carchari]|uniref:Uncharacterized protein n=1 Tax=Saccharicrinis carchari TaxID=1168039 RepID=A0A521B3X0_SACCC|nr:hypothetical protein [Saccharicrinis carchari]SMO41721.1 hypothetical protein SAMN06265379_101680 [Saccharicrinis carchari]
MKQKIKYFGELIAVLLLLNACEINDPIGDVVRTGNFAANVYYEVPNTNSKAGAMVDFYAEYWSVDDQFKALGLWYGIETEFKFDIISGINNFSFTLDSMLEARVPEMIQAFDHHADNYDPDKRAYVINGSFPISFTLSQVQVENPLEYNQQQIDKFFPPSVIDAFYAGLFASMDYELLKDVLVVRFELTDEDTFDTNFDTVEETDPVTGEVISTKVVKEGSGSVLLGWLRQVELKELVYDPIDFKYKANYTKSYKLISKFGVVNGNDILNFSEEKIISVN